MRMRAAFTGMAVTGAELHKQSWLVYGRTLPCLREAFGRGVAL